jgi:hypothetical protein
MSAKTKRRLFIWVPIVLVLLPVVYSLAAGTVTSEDPGPLLELPEGETECVRETDYMRFRHMDLLKEIRDDCVRDGIRKEELNFDRCRECHTSKVRFCNRCHDRVNLEPDCFGCHYWPDEE